MPGDAVYRARGADGLVAARAFLDRVVSAEYDPVVSAVIRADAAAHEAAFDPEHDVLMTAERDGRLVGVLLVSGDAADPDTARFDWLMVDAAELAKREKDWKVPEPRYTSGFLAKYARLAQGAETGAITNT